MSAGTWGGRAIDPKVRDAALEAARKHGLQVGGWLGDALQSHTSDEPIPPLDFEDSDLSRASGRRIAEALERLAQRIEAAEQRSSLAVTGLDRSIIGLVSRVEETETGAREEALRLLALVGELKSAQETLIERLQRAEDNDQIERLQDALGRVDAELARIAGHVDEEVAALSARLEGAGIAFAASIEDAQRAATAQAEEWAQAQGQRLYGMEQRLAAFEADVNEAVAGAKEAAQDAVQDADAALRKVIDDVDGRLTGRIEDQARAADARFDAIGRKFDEAAAAQQAAISSVETRIATATLETIDGLEARIGASLADLRGSVQRISDRTTQAETEAGNAARALSDAVQGLSARLEQAEKAAADAVARTRDTLRSEFTDRLDATSSAISGALSGVFDERVSALSADVKTAIETTRADLDGKLEAAMEALRPDAFEAAVADVGRRLAAAEGRQAQTIEAVSVEIKRLSEAFDRRLRLLEDSGEAPELTRMVQSLQTQFDQRTEAGDSATAGAIAGLQAQVAALADQVQQARAAFADELAAATAALDARVTAQLDSAFAEVDARLGEMETRATHGSAAPRKSAPAPQPSAPPAPPPQPATFSFDDGDAVDIDSFTSPIPLAATIDAIERGHVAPPARPPEPQFDLEPDPYAVDLDDDAAVPLAAKPAPVLEPIEPSRDSPLTRDLSDDDLPPLASVPPSYSDDEGDWSIDPDLPAEEPREHAYGRRLLESDPDLDVLEKNPPQSRAKEDYLQAARRAAQAAAAPQNGKRAGLSLSPRKLIYGAIGVAAVAAGSAAMMLRPEPDAPVQTAATPPPQPAAPVSGPPGSIAEAAAQAAQAQPVVTAAPVETLEQAAERGESVAQFELALSRLSSGDAEQGLPLLRKAADQGLAMAQYRLAKLYEKGEGVDADLQQARIWTERAAMGGNRNAMHDLGVYYARGEGAPLNEAQAFRWFRQAADLGMTNSQFNLGVLYQAGRGVAIDPAEALFWFTVAANSDDADARARAASLSQRVDPSVVAQVRARAAAFRPKPANPRANGEFGPRSWAPTTQAEAPAAAPTTQAAAPQATTPAAQPVAAPVRAGPARS